MSNFVTGADSIKAHNNNRASWQSLLGVGGAQVARVAIEGDELVGAGV